MAMKHAEDQSVDSISAPKTAVSSHHQVHADVEKGSETAKEEIVITWQGDDDSSNPLNFPALKKARILFIVCTCCLCVLCSSSVISTCYTGIEKDLHASPEVAILSLSLFVLGLAIAPPFVAPLSEIGGRKPIYSVSFTLFFLFGFPVAFANNLPVLFIFRFLCGMTGSAFLNVVGGTVTDMWTPKETYIPMAFFTATAFLGPVIGPVYGGFVDQFSSQWRWSLWAIQIWAFVQLLLLLIFCPETFGSAILRNKAQQLRKQNQNGDDDVVITTLFEKSSNRTSILVMMRENVKRIPKLLILEPMLTLLCIWTSVLLGIVYLFFEFFPIVFSSKNFQIYQSGLTFCSLLVGTIIAMTSMPFWKRRYIGQSQQAKAIPPPEAILDPAKVGSLLTVAGLFIFAFTSYPNVPWIGAVIGAAIFGAGTYFIFFSVFIYSTMAWRPVAASALGANSLMRCCFAAGFPLFARQMAHKLTNPGAAALLAGLNCLLIPVPFLLSRYGSKIRARSRFNAP